MKIFIANSSQQKIGGGWSFIANFKKGMGDAITESYEESTIYFLASPSMVQRQEVQQAKADGKKIVLRIDNAVRNSRNRNTGMSRMYDFAQMADLVVYQSNWARDYLMPFTKVDGQVIVNGIDLSLFNDRYEPYNEDTILYSRFNRDETKNWEVARYWYSRYYETNSDSKLIIVGQFSDELREYNFDFYNGERYVYFGVLTTPQMAQLYKESAKFLYTYFNDACSNSLIEALCSGCEIVGDEYYRETGGAKQIIDSFREFGREWFSIDRMCAEYKEALSVL